MNKGISLEIGTLKLNSVFEVHLREYNKFCKALESAFFKMKLNKLQYSRWPFPKSQQSRSPSTGEKCNNDLHRNVKLWQCDDRMNGKLMKRPKPPKIKEMLKRASSCCSNAKNRHI